MDEGTLNDLLECSVCLERLDTSSKVLPCQHTFCRKCLQEILQKHKELRCPECRVLVNGKIEDLPPNVLLMRILEGMKNSAVAVPPKRSLKSHKPSSHHPGVVQQPSAHHNQQQQHVDRSNNKHSTGNVILHQPYAKALYDYLPKEPGDLSFKKGDIIILRRKIDAHWYRGECGGKQGDFPLSYVQIVTPVPSLMPQCKALYDFRMNNDDEEGCLVFNKGDVIHVIRRVDENWAEGRLDGRIGIFPLAFVEMNSLARSLMKLSTNAQPGPSKVAPPTPTSEDTTPLIPTDHTTSVTSVAQNVQVSDSGCNLTSSSSSTTPNVSSSNTSSSSSTAPSSPASPPNRTVVSPHNSGGNVQRHSAEIVQQSSAVSTSASSDRSKRLTAAPDLPLPAAFMALYPYKPQKPDELELKKGGIYMVSEICQDGWYKGTSNRTQKCGVFPGNYVTQARGVPGTQLNVPVDSKLPVSFARGTRNRSTVADSAPPELPPRSTVPPSGVWHVESPARTNNPAKSDVKTKDRKDKGTVGLMRRLTSMKRSKSPPASSYSMDNPVFEDSSLSSLAAPVQPVHVRSTETTCQGGSSESSPDVHRHRKSHSLDATAVKSNKTATQTVRERFRCITPYPPNSEYELELQLNDIIYVHKKREDGWYKGTQQRTGKTGLFPASFVETF